jgi:hypothetical protein
VEYNGAPSVHATLQRWLNGPVEAIGITMGGHYVVMVWCGGAAHAALYVRALVRASGQCVKGRGSLAGTSLLTPAVQSAKRLWAGQLPGDKSEL